MQNIVTEFVDFRIFVSTVLATLPIRTASQGESFAFIGVSLLVLVVHLIPLRP